MKRIIFFTCVAFSFFISLCSAQARAIDSLISKLNNEQVVLRLQYVRYVDLESFAADSLIKIGKTATKKLVSSLNDTSKGVVAQFILTVIWAEDLEKYGWKPGNSVSYEGDIGKGRWKVDIGGLKAFANNNVYRIYSTQNELNRNKKAWLKFLQTQNI